MSDSHGDRIDPPVEGAAPLGLGPSSPDSNASLLADFAERLRKQRPKTIGPYRLLEELGEGGMGVVFKAEQRSPVQRIVALKLIRLGTDTREAIARFEAERQALAVLDHPSIAKVFDGGLTEDGRPFLVMEFVAGVPINVYCDEQCLSVRRRLELFEGVCDAVNHAHQKGLIHRDLKPSNVLITEPAGGGDRALPKVIDFGVAKAVAGQRLTEKTLATQSGQMIGTPEYMSPEQAGVGAPDVDTRSDVYSLGVMLYELLCGSLPFDRKDIRNGELLELQRVLRDVDPPTPSRRLSQLELADAREKARQRRADVSGLTHALRHELEWIPLKAMRKDRAARYASAADMAADIRNYLAGRPLLAGPESGAYRLRKQLARHRGAVFAAGAVVAALIIGIATTGWQAHVASQQRREAQRLQAEAEQQRAEAERQRSSAEHQRRIALETAEYLAGMFRAADPSEARGREVTAVELVNRALSDIDTRFKDEPEIRAILQGNLAHALWSLGRAEQAEPILRDAVEALDRSGARPDANGADGSTPANNELAQTVLNNLAVALETNGRTAEAERIYRRLFDARLRGLGPDDARTLKSQNNLARALYLLGRARESEPISRDVYERRRRVLGPEHTDTLTSAANLGSVLWQLGKREEAEQLSRAALQARQSTLGSDHPDTLESLSILALMLRAQGRADEAEPMLRQCVEQRKRVLGETHPQTLASMSNLGGVLKDLKRLDEAEALYRQTLELMRRTRGLGHPQTLGATNNLAALLMARERFSEAEPLFRQAYDEARRALGEAHPQALSTGANLAVSLSRQGRQNEAETILREIINRARQGLGTDHADTISWVHSLARVLVRQQRYSEAEPLLREVLLVQRRQRGDARRSTRIVATELAECLTALGQPTTADAVLGVSSTAPARATTRGS